MSRRRTPPAERFERYVDRTANGCWLWTGFRNQDGYGLFTVTAGKTVRAHRWLYEQTHGPIPEGLVLDHYLCDERACVNPDHVRPCTQRENTLRSENTQASKNLAKRWCKRGHPYPELKWDGHRSCDECKRQLDRAKRAGKPKPQPREPEPVVRVDPALAERASWLFVGPPGSSLAGGLAALAASREAS